MTDPKPAKSRAKADGNANLGKWVAAGVATGIGSAALVAALLYTNRAKAEDKPKLVSDAPAPESD